MSSIHRRGCGSIFSTLAGVILLALASSGCSAAGNEGDLATQGAEQAIAAGNYNFGTLASPGKCLDVNAAGTADGSNIQSWTCNGSGAQSFRADDLGGGLVRLVNTNSNKCVDIAAAGTADGTNVQLWTCNGTGAQSFRVDDLGGGNVRIVNPNSNKCIDVAAAGTADGTNVQLWTCNGTNAQAWRPANIGTPPAGGGTPTSSCAAWQAGHNYVTGDKVLYNGSGYIATHDNPGYDPTISTWFWSPTTGCSAGGTTTGGGGTTTGTGFSAIVSEGQFNAMFPSRNGFYSYAQLVAATGSYTGFVNTGDTATRKREAAAFLANVDHETGGLVYIEEIAKAPYCGGGCSCAAGKQYYGRGPLQLSWNYNYCAAGSALGLNLQGDPDMVARDAKVAWQTSLWFWNTQTGAGTMTGHNAMVNNAGFGQTIRTINGSIECNGGAPASVQARVNAYVRFCGVLGVDPGANTGC